MPDASGLVAPAAAVPSASQQAPAAPPDPTQTAQAAPPAAPTAPTDAPKLPSELLKVHALQALMAGRPAAVSAPIKDFSHREEGHLIKKHKDALTQAGFGLYRSLSGDLGVIFNSLYIHPADLMAADKAGKLKQIAPSWDDVSHAVSKSGIHNPVLKAGGVPAGLANPTMQPAPQATAAMAPNSSPVAQQPAGAQRKAMMARLANIQPGPPTSGAAPGAGRILNQILKPVV